MVHIEPFRGVRPRRDIAHLVAAPPYDVLSSEEARETAAGNPYSFLHIGKPEIDLPPGIDPYSDEVYAKGKDNFDRFVREGILGQDPGRNFYIYKQVWGDHVQVGLVAGASCQDYLDDIIKKRYASYDSGIGAKIEAGTTNFKELEAYVLKQGSPKQVSGKQEMLENVLNQYLLG